MKLELVLAPNSILERPCKPDIFEKTYEEFK